jgi:hypothetical protein
MCRVGFGALCCALAVLITPTEDVQADRLPIRVALYGDSIGEETSHYLSAAIEVRLGSAIELDRNVYGGTNACDFLEAADNDVHEPMPQIIVIIFTGNAFTPCMQKTDGSGPLDGPERIRKTVDDSIAVAARFPDSQVLLVGYARSEWMQVSTERGGSTSRTDMINGLLETAVVGTDWTYVDGGAALLYRGRFAKLLPCTDRDPHASCRNGRVHVRADDGMHLCPRDVTVVGGALGVCPVHNSGAMRLAHQIASGVQLGS